MWQVVAGQIVYTPVTAHTRSALGTGYVRDTLTQIEVNHGR